MKWKNAQDHAIWRDPNKPVILWPSNQITDSGVVDLLAFMLFYPKIKPTCMPTTIILKLLHKKFNKLRITFKNCGFNKFQRVHSFMKLTSTPEGGGWGGHPKMDSPKNEMSYAASRSFSYTHAHFILFENSENLTHFIRVFKVPPFLYFLSFFVL